MANSNFFGQLREIRFSEAIENIAGERLKVASTQNEIKSAFEEAYSDLGYKAEIKFSTPEETPELKDKAGNAYVLSTGVHTMIININAKENSTKSRLIGTISEEESYIINGSKGRQIETGTEEKGLESTGRATNSYFQDKYKDDKTTISIKSDGAIDTSKLGTNVGDKLLIKKSNFESLKNDLGEFMDYKYAIENCKSNFCASEKFDGSSREEIREYIKQAKKVGALESVSLPNYETESQLNQITENIYNQCSVNNSCPRLVNQKDIKEFYGYYYLEKQENNINNEKNRLKSVCANDICFSKEEFEATFIKEQNIRKEAGQNNRKSYKFRYAR